MPTLFSPDSVFLQRFLRTAGLYKGDMDGIIGPKTNAALLEFTAILSKSRTNFGTFDKRSEEKIRTMLPPTQQAARKFVSAVGQADLSDGLSVQILSAPGHLRNGQYSSRNICRAAPWLHDLVEAITTSGSLGMSESLIQRSVYRRSR
jgi:hypothetical protein